MNQFTPPMQTEEQPSPYPPLPKTSEVPQPTIQPETPRKMSGTAKLVLTLSLALLAVFFIGIMAVISHSPSSSPGTSTYTFSGNGIQQTQTITLSDDWTLSWTCDPSSFFGGQYNVIVNVYNTDGTLAAVAVNTICSDGNTSGSTEMHQGGNVYLEINSEAAWSLTVTG